MTCAAKLIGFPMRRSPSGERGSSTNVEINILVENPRATNRPDEQIVIYLPGKWTSNEISAIASRLPGVNIEKVATYDVCPKAAQKGEQTERKIIFSMSCLYLNYCKIIAS
ncbi:MAG: hypothetical protein F6K48_04435 [Okeania sp. SIO3H1]|nr:hypothetical protein [Okeania sp. SIO3H1]